MRQLLLIVLIAASGCTNTSGKNPHIVIKTSIGNIELELYPEKAPLTVAAFLSYIDSGYYNNTNFYRVLNLDNQPSNAPKAELIQGGIFRSKNKRGIDPPGIPHETTKQTGLRHTDGTISLARLAPGTASTEFFICIGEQPGFDFGGENNPDKQGYAAFGKVVSGLNVVNKIYNQREDNQYFTPPVPVYNIVRQ
ncbi:MAG: peptidylprolyl isomerase [Chitinophagaceae bacterium]|nr:MAG: peptidylprolyl isomerase [Chitinophagaceae bacterium]